jgi:hypothetical protein
MTRYTDHMEACLCHGIEAIKDNDMFDEFDVFYRCNVTSGRCDTETVDESKSVEEPSHE